jgi:hypothetical protein
MRVHHARLAPALLLLCVAPAAAEPVAQHKRAAPNPIAWLFRVSLHVVDDDALPTRVLHVDARRAAAPATPQPWAFDSERDRGCRDEPQPQPLAGFRFGRGWTLASAPLRDRPRSP